MLQVLTATILSFCISLSPTWGLLQLDNGQESYFIPHDFTYETASHTYHVQTTPYWNQGSIKFCEVGIREDQTIVFSWDLDGNHPEFKKGIICNTQTGEQFEFPIRSQGSVEFCYNIGLNTFDLYCYTGNTVGIIEFDLFNVLILHVEEKHIRETSVRSSTFNKKPTGVSRCGISTPQYCMAQLFR